MATTDPIEAVKQYIDAFNKGDADAMAATFSAPGAILDGMAPHLWVGNSPSQDWYRDVLVEGEQHGASEYFVTLGEPLHNNITGDSAYVVVPATMTFKVAGQEIKQTGAVFTVLFVSSPKVGASLPGHGPRVLACDRSVTLSESDSFFFCVSSCQFVARLMFSLRGRSRSEQAGQA